MVSDLNHIIFKRVIMAYWKNFLLVFFLILSQTTNSLQASPFFLLDEVTNLEAVVNKEVSPPNPMSLQPQWWHYFQVDEDELKQRIAITTKNLQEVYATLSFDDQATASPLINKIVATLNALSQAKKIETSIPASSAPFLKTYTLEKQIELNKSIRKAKVDIINETERRNQLHNRIAKAQKVADNMLVAYLGQTQSSSKKLLAGLEIMAYRSNIGLGELNLKIADKNIEEQNAKLTKLEEELNYSKKYTDTSEVDQNKLEQNIALSQTDLENKQNELSTAENNLLGAFNDNHNDRSAQVLLEQMVLQATINRAHAWTVLAYHRFKYNLVMYLNDRFQEGHNDLRKDLRKWHEQLATVSEQAQEWRKMALKEQDRIRQEYTFLIAQNENPESQKMRLNQSMRQGFLNILAALELLEEDISSTEWLVNLLEDYFKVHSSVWLNWWISITSSVAKGWNNIVYIMNFSLFKIMDIPITLFTIIKVLSILAISFWLSVFFRSSLKTFGKRRDVSESTLYSLGSLGHYFILLIGFIIALCSIGLDFGNLVFIAGALMFGISLGLQSLANNFFSGLRILFERKLKIGDDIELNSGHHGKVIEIHIQNTVVKTNDGQKIIVPNSELVGNTVVNWTRHHHDYRRLHVPFAVATGCDKELIRKIVTEAAKRVPCVLNGLPEYGDPQVWLVNITSYALEFKLVVWVDYNADAETDSKEADFLWEIESALNKNEIPLPPLPHYLFPASKSLAIS
jgi:potassium-dependent mechanosensitive channel